MTTNKGICEQFCDYFKKLFPTKLGLYLAQFDNYLFDFPNLKATEEASCNGCISEEEVWEMLKKFRKDENPANEAVIYFVTFLVLRLNHWMEQRSIP